ncbi:hypothetical protein Vadar_019289 [Vaccinium darrowii]|uniref:Uncharacterized protein n=1 Tax=Vaccinium darrowii TaxID=229202 RepID=A0ACB7XRM1_9ERIC|nr:hypothetical protein Vadar_019289 [Vaccinium darrowii]
MSSALIIVDKIVEYIVGKVFQPAERHVGFLFHYKKNIKNLEDEKNNLQQQRSNDTDKASQGVDTFMDEKVVKENMWFCNFLGPDFIWCYRLSKQAEKKAVSIKQLAKKGSEIGTVSHPREDPLELELPSSKDYEDFNSRQKVFKGIVEALKDSNVNMIGVYGTGGVGIPITDGKKNCKVVLTSRNQDVGKKMDVHKDFTIKIFSHEEAWALFKKVVENNVDSHDQRLRDIAWDICKECQGLPVVIKALGATLKGKEMYAWEDALDKLKNCLLKDVEGIEPKVLPPEVGELAHLRLLDMSYCVELQMIPKGVISKLLRVEELYMPPNFHRWEGAKRVVSNTTLGFSFEDFCMLEDLCLWEETLAERETSKVSLDELMLLSQLTTLHIFIKDPRILPKGNFFFENLVRFNIRIGRPGGLHDEVLDGALTLQNAHVENALEYLLGKPQHKQSIKRNGVTGTEGEKDEDILIKFSGLKSLILEDPPKLISFYPKMEKTATSSESSSACGIVDSGHELMKALVVMLRAYFV